MQQQGKYDYKDAKIYKISSPSTDKIYIGSTARLDLQHRMRAHQSHYKKYVGGTYHHISVFDILQFGDASIELLEAYPCNNRKELQKKEGEYIKNNANCLNVRVEGRTLKEWYIDNKPRIKEVQLKYVEANKEKILAREKAYREANKEKLAMQKKAYVKANKEKIAARRKAYVEANKEKIAALRKAYAEANREKINEKLKAYQKVKVTCDDCKIELTRGSMALHKKSKKHLAALNPPAVDDVAVVEMVIKAPIDPEDALKRQRIAQQKYRETHPEIKTKEYQCACGTTVLYKDHWTHLKTAKHAKLLAAQTA